MDWELEEKDDDGDEACEDLGPTPGAIGKDVIFQLVGGLEASFKDGERGRDLGSVRDTRRLDEVPIVQIVLGWRRPGRGGQA